MNINEISEKIEIDGKIEEIRASDNMCPNWVYMQKKDGTTNLNKIILFNDDEDNEIYYRHADGVFHFLCDEEDFFEYYNQD